jgi:hypothetical protein
MSGYGYSFVRRLISSASGTKSGVDIRPAVTPDILPQNPGLPSSAPLFHAAQSTAFKSESLGQHMSSVENPESNKPDDGTAVTVSKNSFIDRNSFVSKSRNAGEAGDALHRVNLMQPEGTDPGVGIIKSNNRSPVSFLHSKMTNNENKNNNLTARPDASQMDLEKNHQASIVSIASGNDLDGDNASGKYDPELAKEIAPQELLGEKLDNNEARKGNKTKNYEGKKFLISEKREPLASFYGNLIQEGNGIASAHEPVYKKGQPAPSPSAPAAPLLAASYAATTNNKILSAAIHSEPTVTINIGRIEVRVLEPVKKQNLRANYMHHERRWPQQQQQSAPVSLEKYLKERAGTRK